MLALKDTPNIFFISVYVSSLLRKIFATLKCVCWKIENNYF